MAGSSTDSRSAFFFDLASPVAYLAAERALQTHPGVEWVPVLARELPGAETFDAYRCAEERDIALAQIERAAAEQGLQPLRWPDPFPFDSLFAMRVATYAKQLEGGYPEVARIIHGHPTLSEGVMEAARAADGWVIHG